MVKTHRRRRSNKMRGGMSSLMPASINDFNHGNFASSQSSVSSGSIGATNVSLAQSGGSRSRRRKGRRGMRMRGGLAPLSPELLDAPSQKGGYFSSVLKAALVPFGLMGLNQYAHEHSGKTASRGKSRLSKKLHRRHNR